MTKREKIEDDICDTILKTYNAFEKSFLINIPFWICYIIIIVFLSLRYSKNTSFICQIFEIFTGVLTTLITMVIGYWIHVLSHRLQFTDSAGNQWRMAANYKGNGAHGNAHNNYRLYAHIGSANSFHRISGSADVAAAGAINFTLYTTSATGGGNDNWRTMNPDNNDDSRAYPNSNTKSFSSLLQIFEIQKS